VGYLDEEFSVKHASEPKPVWKKSKSPKNLPLQSNGSDCGVFICMYALALASGGNLQEATAERVPVMRRRIACDIVRGRVKKWPIIV
jgi:Ulp1 family protease